MPSFPELAHSLFPTLVVLVAWFLSALLLKSSVSKSEKKWVEGRVKVTKHHKNNSNFIGNFSST